MNTAYKTIVKVDYGFELNKARPVTTFVDSITNTKCSGSHSHSRAQLISCNTGIMEVVTKNNIWIVNSFQSVWISSNEEHQVYFPKNVEVVSAFIDQSKTNNLPKETFAFENSNFLNSILEKITSFSNPNTLTIQQNRIVNVFLDELSQLKPSTTFLPTSQDERIKKILDHLMNDIASKHSIDYYANLLFISPRTLSRLFNKELGMSFGNWKMRLKLIEAVKQLGENKSIKEIAFNLGYENVSSFTTIFKKHFGKTPSNYL
jgi:AraC-like DNA-binding protein